jgi:hypothetical protein
LKQGRHNRSNQNQSYCQADGYIFAKPEFSQRHACQQMTLERRRFETAEQAGSMTAYAI